MTAPGTDPRDALTLRDIRPSVALPHSVLSGSIIFALCALAAVMLFLWLDARRRALDVAREQPIVIAQLPPPPPPLSLPPELLPTEPAAPPPIAPSNAATPVTIDRAPPPTAQFQPPSPTAAPLPQTLTAQRAEDKSPAMVVDESGVSRSNAPGNPTVSTAANGTSAGAIQSEDDAVRATLIRNRGVLIPQGALIAAVLETPLNSDRPGLARAIVSRDARSFDGSRVLIPRGSRLIGEFRATGDVNLRRVLVTWTRLIRPDGVAIRIGSPATDALGGAGIAGSVNTHFFERFANAVLQSALTIGVEVASRTASRGAGSVVVGVPGQLNSIGQQLLPNIQPRTTVKVREGAEIGIFVARDLDFGGTPPVR